MTLLQGGAGVCRNRTVGTSQCNSDITPAIAKIADSGCAVKVVCIGIVCAALCLTAKAADLNAGLLEIQDILERGDFAEASKRIAAAMQEHPNNGGLFNLRGVVHARQNELAQARKDFSEAVRLSPGLTPAWQNLARACLLQAEQDATVTTCAADSWQHVLKLDPQNAEAHVSLARLLQQQGHFADSLRQLERLPPGERENTFSQLLRCADLAAVGRTAEALQTAKRISERKDFSEEDLLSFQNALRLPQGAAVAVLLLESLDTRKAAGAASLRWLTIAYEQQQHPEKARQVLERLALLEPRDTAHLLELARLANRAKDYEAAIGYLAHARDIEPNNAQIHYLFAMIATKMNLPIEARASMVKALAIQPDNPTYNYAMGYIILSSRDGASAASYFERFVASRPNEVKGHYALGIAKFASGDYDGAKVEMERVKGEAETAGAAEYFLGRIARQEGDPAAAVRHLQKSAALAPTYSESHTELGRLAIEEGDLKKAEAELELAIRLDASSFQAHTQLLKLYRRTHDARAGAQAERLKRLDEERSKRAELMLRTIEVRPLQ